MILFNNKPKGRYLTYKLGNQTKKYYFNGFQSIDIAEITDESQIIENTFERRLRIIEDKFGKDLKTAFEIPADPDYPDFLIVSSTSALGSISPLGNIKVPETTNKTFSMTPNAISFVTNASSTSGGTISPSGTSISTKAYNYLSELLVDGVSQLSAVTGNVSATTNYTFTNVLATHTTSSTFSLMPGSTTFAITANSNFYLNDLLLNGSSDIGSVTGNVSGSSAYVLTNITTDNTIVATFNPFGS